MIAKTKVRKRSSITQARGDFLRLRFTVIVEPDGDSFHAYSPAFKGLHVDGRTEDEALRNAAKAALVYVNSLAAHGEPLPIPKRSPGGLLASP